MQYNVAQLLKEPIGSSRSYQLDETLRGADRFADHLRGSVRLLKTHQGVLVEARVDVDALLICGRCLCEYPLNLRFTVEEEFFPMVDVNTGRNIPSPDELEGILSEGVLINESHTLDLSEVVRQYVITNSPMKPLCSAGCGGLCQNCGADRDRQECQCDMPPSPDPRWGDLVGFLRQEPD